jgi:hypothetical protein
MLRMSDKIKNGLVNIARMTTLKNANEISKKSDAIKNG